MLYAYVKATGDLAILNRAFPLAEVCPRPLSTRE